MKIALSKAQWETIGVQAGWIKQAACMEHQCKRCDYTWFDNSRGRACPKCGGPVASFYDDDPSDAGDDIDMNDSE